MQPGTSICVDSEVAMTYTALASLVIVRVGDDLSHVNRPAVLKELQLPSGRYVRSGHSCDSSQVSACLPVA